MNFDDFTYEELIAINALIKNSANHYYVSLRGAGFEPAPEIVEGIMSLRRRVKKAIHDKLEEQLG